MSDDRPMRVSGGVAGVAIRTPAKFRLTAPVVPEQDLHESVADALDKLLLGPAEWTCFPAGSVPLPPQFAAKLARMGLKRGWPDVLVLSGRLYGIELKRRGGRLSRTKLVRGRSGILREMLGQDVMFPRLEHAGMTIGVCHSVDEVLAFLASAGVPLRAHAVAA
jgi:hypothetical protein